MAEPVNFDAYTQWVDTTDPNNLPPNAKVITAADLMRYEKLGQDVAAWTAQFTGTLPEDPNGDVIDGGTP